MPLSGPVQVLESTHGVAVTPSSSIGMNGIPGTGASGSTGCTFCVGLRVQLHELIERFAAGSVTLIDVGGDVVATGTEPTLSSPLADALALAAATGLPVRTDVAVAGPGLDGELAEPNVRAVLATAGSDCHRLSASDAKGFLAALNRHPSEATTLLAASALGISGLAEIRDSAALVPVNEASADFFVTTGEAALGRNAVARRLMGTRSLDEAEAAVHEICGFTELDHERAKAHALAGSPERETTRAELRARLEEYRISARARGVDLGSFRPSQRCLADVGTIRT